MSALEYFRGGREEVWPEGAVYLDTGYIDPVYYTIRLVVGECSMEISSREAKQILYSVMKAEERLEALSKK